MINKVPFCFALVVNGLIRGRTKNNLTDWSIINTIFYQAGLGIDKSTVSHMIKGTSQNSKSAKSFSILSEGKVNAFLNNPQKNDCFHELEVNFPEVVVSEFHLFLRSNRDKIDIPDDVFDTLEELINRKEPAEKYIEEALTASITGNNNVNIVSYDALDRLIKIVKNLGKSPYGENLYRMSSKMEKQAVALGMPTTLSDPLLLEIWRLVVEKESTAPGFFSSRTLNVLRDLTPEEAKAFLKASEASVYTYPEYDEGVPIIFVYYLYNQDYVLNYLVGPRDEKSTIDILKESGLLFPDIKNGSYATGNVLLDPNEPFLPTFFDTYSHSLFIKSVQTPESEYTPIRFNYSYYQLTSAGTQLLPLFQKQKENPDFLLRLGRFLQERYEDEFEFKAYSVMYHLHPMGHFYETYDKTIDLL